MLVSRPHCCDIDDNSTNSIIVIYHWFGRTNDKTSAEPEAVMAGSSFENGTDVSQWDLPTD